MAPAHSVLEKYSSIKLFKALTSTSFQLNPAFPVLKDDNDVLEFNTAAHKVFVGVANGMGASLKFSSESFFEVADGFDKEVVSRAIALLKEVALDLCTARGLTEGGDERLMLTPKATNKYHCSPIPPKEMVVRCSCTGSSPSSLGFDTARRHLESIWAGRVSVNESLLDVRTRVKNALNLNSNYHVVLFPSGSDAEYLPLHMAIRRGQKLGNMSGIVNIVAAKGEVGSGTPGAAGGLHFDKYTPCGDLVAANQTADGLANATSVSVKQLMAREVDGSLHSNFDDQMTECVRKLFEEDKDRYIIVHSVEGTKTGLCVPSLDCLTGLRNKYGDRVLPVVDACQLRCNKTTLEESLDAGAVVLITGSKFFGGPAFCGAVLVPDSLASDLNVSDVASGLGQYLSSNEIPTEMDLLRSNLPAWDNIGLSLRWTAAVAEMEDFAKQPQAEDLISSWVEGVKTAMNALPNSTLEVVEDSADKTSGRLGNVNSIVSFKVKRGSASGTPLTAPELKELYSWLSIDASQLLGESATKEEQEACRTRVMTGQPVPVCDAFGVLRLAVGAPMVRDLASRGLEACLRDDLASIRKLSALGHHYDECLANHKAGAKASVASSAVSAFPWDVLANTATKDRFEELSNVSVVA